MRLGAGAKLTREQQVLLCGITSPVYERHNTMLNDVMIPRPPSLLQRQSA